MKIVRLLFLPFWILCLPTQADQVLTLHFQYVIDDGTGQLEVDDFYAIGRTDISISDSLDAEDLRKPPGLPGASAQISTFKESIALLGDARYLNSDFPNTFWPIQLNYETDNYPEGAIHTLKVFYNPELYALPEDVLVYVRRYDCSGEFIEYHDLTRPTDIVFVWQTVPDQHFTSQIDLAVIHGCIASNLNNFGLVDFRDFAVLADNWLQDGVYGIADISGNDTVDVQDLLIMARHWLADCLP